MVEYIINEEIISEFIQNQIQTNSRSTQSKKLKQNRTKTIEILPYENTYGSFYYPDQSISIDKTMLDKIIRGVQAMAMALTNTVIEYIFRRIKSLRYRCRKIWKMF